MFGFFKDKQPKAVGAEMKITPDTDVDRVLVYSKARLDRLQNKLRRWEASNKAIRSTAHKVEYDNLIKEIDQLVARIEYCEKMLEIN